jgi:hypothetical protein
MGWNFGKIKKYGGPKFNVGFKNSIRATLS